MAMRDEDRVVVRLSVEDRRDHPIDSGDMQGSS
jgi:hypothetical protein